MTLDDDMRWFDKTRDLEQIQRIWQEVGWVEGAQEVRAVEDFFSVGTSLTGLVEDGVECAVHVCPGTLRLDQTDLALCAVTAVTTSHVGRKLGFAQRLTSIQLQRAAQEGAQVAALGMFEQGFYDKLGFGSASYEHEFTFDPATLTVPVSTAVPRRLSKDDWVDMHRALCRRMKAHGSVVLEPPSIIAAELAWTANGFGFGYYDGDELTHCLWLSTQDIEYGPLRVEFMAYRNLQELMELMGFLRSLGDQYRSVSMTEPVHLHLQDWLHKPFRRRGISRGSKHEAQHRATSWRQLRILDLPACVAALSAVGPVPPFRLEISDPIGCVDGVYTVSLGQTSSAKREESTELPMIRASVNAFSRLLFGIVPASTLALADDFDVADALAAELDRAICLPAMRPGWDF